MKNYMCIFLLCLVLFTVGCSKSNEAEAENIDVYASEIYFEKSDFNLVVGEKIEIDTLGLTIKPQNATVLPKFWVDDIDIANIIDGVLYCYKEGEAQIVASIQTSSSDVINTSLSFCVSEKLIYATGLKFNYNKLVLDVNEQATNLLTINPINYNVEFVEVIYANDEPLATYNYKTGVVTAEKMGSEHITVKVKSGEKEYHLATFEVEVNTYANKFNDILINDKSVINQQNDEIIIEDIVLLTGDEGVITARVEPADYNLSFTYSTSNNIITINENGEFIVEQLEDGKPEDNCEIYISALKNNKGDIVEKFINVTIIKANDNIEFEIKKGVENIEYAYVGVEYDVYILNDFLDYNQIIFENCNFKYEQNNHFKISFKTAADDVIVKYKYSYFGFIENRYIENNLKINVYNLVEDIVFSLYCGNTELLPNSNNTYIMQLPNENSFEEAISAGASVVARFEFSPKSQNTKPNALQMEVSGDSISLNDYKITAISEGESYIKIYATEFEKTYTIKVEPIMCDKVDGISDSITLLLNGEGDEDKYFLSYTALPNYAYYNEITLELSSNNYVEIIENNYIKGIKEGDATLKFYNNKDDILKEVEIKVKYVVTRISAYVNGNQVENDSEVIVWKSEETCGISTKVFSKNNEVLNESATIAIDEAFCRMKCTFQLDVGEYSCEVSYENITINFLIICKDLNPITSFEFINEQIEVNINETSTIDLLELYSFSKYYADKETTDVLTFSSSDTNIVTISGDYNTLTILSAGTVTISANVKGSDISAILVITILTNEYHYINNENDFANIEIDGVYRVNCNLNLSKVPTISAFRGEIDFDGHAVSGVGKPIFETLCENSVIKNIVFEGNYIIKDGAKFSFIAHENNGTIENITFNNVKVTYDNGALSQGIYLICITNNNLIKDINFNDVTFDIVNRKILYITSVCDINNCTIAVVNGSVSFSNFSYAAGITNENTGIIKSVELDVLYSNCDGGRMAGLVFMAKNNSQCKDITLNITGDLKSTTHHFSGFIFNIEIAVTSLLYDNIVLYLPYINNFENGTIHDIVYNNQSKINLEKVIVHKV